jgi:cytidine deaminase
MGSQIDWDILIERARAARKHAYAAYSHFAVGAALVTESGEIFTGCNLENVSLGLTICAERVAVFGAVSAGFREFAGIAVATEAQKPVAPCGACRQVLAEFNPSLPLCCIGRADARDCYILSALLPAPFVSFPEAQT